MELLAKSNLKAVKKHQINKELKNSPFHVCFISLGLEPAPVVGFMIEGEMWTIVLTTTQSREIFHFIGF